MSREIIYLNVPRTGVNDEKATLVEWYTPNESQVTAGQLVCAMETTKSVFEVEASGPGFILHMAKAGDDIPVGGNIALIGPDLNALKKTQTTKVTTEKTTTKATKKALALAQQLSVDIDDIASKGIITEEDVRKHAEHACDNKHLDDWVTYPTKDEPGFLDLDFLKKLQANEHFANLDSESKVNEYRKFGAEIADGVTIGKGTIIFSPVIRLGKDAIIGQNCHIKTERFVLGRMSVIGNNAQIATREVIIGDVLFSGNDIMIGGGGAWGPRSCLKVGDSCLISSHCLINTAEPVTLGNEIGLSPKVQLFTHSHWQDILKGYSDHHGAITIEDEVYITGNCLVVPGTKLGRGSCVLANSVVSSDVEPYAVVSGVPAKVVSRIKTDLSRQQQDRIVRRFMDELHELLRFRKLDEDKVVYTQTFDAALKPDAQVVLTFETLNMPGSPDKFVVFDLTERRLYGEQNRLSDEVRNFLRRKGIRFKPIYWRYEHDKDLYVQ